MIEGLKPYPAYKTSTSPWIGEIPGHWTEKRAKCFYREVDERSTTGEEELLSVSHKTGVTPRRAHVTMFMAESNVGHKICRPNDVVINTMWAFMAALGVAKEVGVVSPSYGVYRPRRPGELHPQFVDQLLRVESYKAEYLTRSTGINSSRLRLYPDQFLRIPIICPPREEQSAIVRFLDHADRRIRRYIGAKRRLIALLNEQKQAIIHRAVTRGLDPNVRLKPSGIEWLGDVPEHWEVRSMRYTTRILRGRFLHRPRNDPQFYDGEFPFIQTGDISAAKKHITGYTQTLNKRGLAISKMFPAGTLAMIITGAKTGHVAILGFDACFPDSAVGFFPLRGLAVTDYLYYLFIGLKAELDNSAVTSTQENLNVERIGAQVAAWPPIDEQRLIADKLNETLESIEKIKSTVEKEVRFIREYHARLITEVVTGKLDVRAATAQLRAERVEKDDTDDANVLTDGEETLDDKDLDAEPVEVEV